MYEALSSFLADPSMIKTLWIAFVSTYAFTLTMDLGRSVFEVVFNFFRAPGSPPLKTLTTQECAIILPCHQSGDCIEATLDTLPSEYTVICVANACRDDTVEVLNRCKSTYKNLVVINTDTPGKIRAVLLGVIYARKMGFNYFLLLDDDVEWTQFFEKPAPVTLYNRDKSVTALPVVPSNKYRNWISNAQSIEYQIMCASKRAQGNLGNVIMASGAAGIYQVETFIEAMQDHDGEHIGDDLQCSYIHHTKGLKIDFNSECVVLTHPPGTLKEWWKQRAKRWEASPIYNMNWALRVMFAPPYGKKNPGWWIRAIALYRSLVVVNDLLRCVSFPIVLVASPLTLIGVWGIAYCSVILKMLAFMYFFQHQKYVLFDRITVISILTFPLYEMLTWMSRVRAIPVGIGLTVKRRLTGKRKVSKFSHSFGALEQEASQQFDERNLK